MPRLLKQGNPERGLVENNFGSTSLSRGDQSFPQHYYNGNVQVQNSSALLRDSNLNAFQPFWPRIYFLHLIDVPWILLDCNFTQRNRLLRFQISHSTNFTNGAHVMGFPTCCCFCHIDFRSLSDDDRIVSHDAIFYVRDATSKLSWIPAWNNMVFSGVYFSFLLQ